MEQKSLEQFFNEAKITDPDEKVKLLNDLTSLVYDRNNALVKAEREADENLKEGFLHEAQETDTKIWEIINDFLKK